MRIIPAEQLRAAVARLCIEANRRLPADIRRCIDEAARSEPWPTAQGVLEELVQNYRLAEENEVPICQDTGMACVFLDIGQDAHIEGDATAAVNEGVREGYREGLLRKSVVGDPLERVNTGDNTPAMLTVSLVPGDRVTVTVAPKGFGSENMSRIAMLKPSDGEEGVAAFVLETLRLAGPNPCPPMVVGVGLGGTFDKAALLAKRALLRQAGVHHPAPRYAALEKRLLREANTLGIGPQGYGGAATALWLAIETLPTHIAGLPCAVNINCHVARHASEVL